MPGNTARFQLDLIMNAQEWRAGSQQAVLGLQRISAAASQAGLSLDDYIDKQVAAANEAIKSGKVQGEEAELLAAQLESVNKKREKAIAKGLKGFEPQQVRGSSVLGIDFDKEESRIDGLSKRLNKLGGDLERVIFGKLKGAQESPFGALIGDAQSFSDRVNTLNDRLDKMKQSSVEIINIFDGVSRAAKDLVPSKDRLQNLNLLKERAEEVRAAFRAARELIDFKGADASIKKIDDVINTLGNSTGVSAYKLKQMRAEIDNIVSATGLAHGGFSAFIQDQSSLIRVTEDVISTLRAEKKQFDDLSRNAGFNIGTFDEFAKLSKADQLSLTTDALSGANLKRFIADEKTLSATLGKTSGSIDEQKGKIIQLNNFINQFGSLVGSTNKPSKEMDANLRSVATAMGITVRSGATFNEFAQAFAGKLRDARAELSRMEKAQAVFAKLNLRAAGTVNNLAELTEIAIGKLLRYRIAFFLMFNAIQGLKDAVRTFKEVQSALADIEKVADPVLGQIAGLKKEAFGFAKEFGESVGNVLNIMKIFAQQGKSFSEIVDLTRVSLIAAAGSGLTTEQAVEGLTAAMIAFNIPANNTIEIIDKFAAAQARFAVDASDYADAVKVVAAAASEVGIGIDSLIGQVTAIGEATRKTGKEVATSLKTLFERSVRNETADALREIGIQARNTDGTIKPLDNTLFELSQKWDSLTQSQRLNIAQLIGGGRRYNDFLILMRDYSKVLEAAEVSLTSQGAAQRNAAIELKTFNRQIEIVKAGLQETFESIASAGLAQTATGLLALVDGISRLINFVPGLKQFAAAFILISTALAVGKIASVAYNIALTQWAKLLKIVTGAQTSLALSFRNLESVKAAEYAQTLLNLNVGQESIAFIKALNNGNKQAIITSLKALSLKAQEKGVVDSVNRAKLEEILITALNTKATNEDTKAKVANITVNRALGASLLGLVGGPTGAFTAIITGLTLGGILWSRNAFKVKEYGDSVTETGKKLRGQIEIQSRLIDDMERNILIADKLKSSQNLVEKSAEGVTKARILEQSIVADLVRREPQLTKALDDQTGKVFNTAKALEILAEKRKDLESLRREEEVLAASAVDASDRITHNVGELLNKLAQYRATASENVKFTDPVTGLKESLDAGLKRAKSTALVKIGVTVDPQNINDQVKTLSPDLQKSFDKEFLPIAKTVGKNYVDAYVDSSEKQWNKELKPLIKSWGQDLSTLGIDVNEVTRKINFKDIRRDARAFVDQSKDFRDVEKRLREQIDPLRLITAEIVKLGAKSNETFLEFARLRTIKLVAEDTGIEFEKLTEIIEKTVLAADKLNEKFTSVANLLQGSTPIGEQFLKTQEELGIQLLNVDDAVKASDASLQQYVDTVEYLDTLFRNINEKNANQVIDALGLVKNTANIESQQVKELIDQAFRDSGNSLAKFEEDLSAGRVDTARWKELKKIIDAIAADPNTLTGFRDLANALIEVENNTGTAKNKLDKARNTLLTIAKAAKELTLNAGQSGEKFRDLAASADALETSLKGIADIQKQTIGSVFAKLTDLADSFGLSEEEVNKLLAIQNQAIDNTETAQIRVLLIEKNRGKTLEQIDKMIEDQTPQYKRAQVVVKAQLALEKEQLKNKTIVGLATNRIAKAGKEIADNAKLQLEKDKAILETAIKIAAARNESLGGGFGKAREEAKANDLRIALLERELGLVKKLGGSSSALADATEASSDSIKRAIDLLDVSQADKDTLFDIVSSRGLVSIQKLNDYINKTGKDLNDAKVAKFFLDAAAAVETINDKIRIEIDLLKRTSDLEEQALNKRLEILGITGAAAQKAQLNFRKAALEEELKLLLEEAGLSGEVFDKAKDQILAWDEAGSSITDIIDLLKQGLNLNEDQVNSLLEHNLKLKEFRDQLLKIGDDAVFNDIALEIENSNKILDIMANKLQNINTLMSDFKDQSVSFQTESGQGAVTSLEIQLATILKQRQEAEKILATRRSELAIAKENLNKSTEQGVAAQLVRQEYFKAVEAQATQEARLKNINSEEAELRQNIAKATVEASKMFKDAYKGSQQLRTVVEGIAETLSTSLRTVPSVITTQFDTIFNLQSQIRDKQQEIIDAEANIDPLSNEYQRSLSKLEQLKKEEADLQEQLRNESSIVRQIGEGFAKVGEAVGNIVLDVQADALKDKLTEAFGNVFKGEEEARYNSIIRAYQSNEVQVGLYNPIFRAISDGSEVFKAAMISVLPAQPNVTSPGTSFNFQGQTHNLPSLNIVGKKPTKEGEILPVDIAGKPFDPLKKSSNKMFEAGTALLQFAATIGGTAIGGGGQGAQLGSTAGSLLGLINPALGIFGSLAGGLIGGLFDKKPEIPKLEQAVRDNTIATNFNTQQLKDLRGQLINAPARFTIPAFASQGGQINSESLGLSSVGSSSGSIVIQQSFSGNVSPEKVKEATKQAIQEAYADDLRKFGKRVRR